MRIPHPVSVGFPPRDAHEKMSSTCAKIPTILSSFFPQEKKWLNLSPNTTKHTDTGNVGALSEAGSGARPHEVLTRCQRGKKL